MTVELQNVTYRLPEFVIDVTASTTSRSTAIYGPSGAGKTTLLELIAGLRRPETGRITIDGRLVADAAKGVFVPASERRIGFVPQDGALFPHLSVRRNILYGRRNGSAGEAPSLDALVEVLEIGHTLERGVGRLSGGERKRVALARALMSAPAMLLLDEPMAGIDRALRDRILSWLRRLRDELALPMLYVTHEREELSVLCDEIVVLDRGRVVDGGPLNQG